MSSFKRRLSGAMLAAACAVALVSFAAPASAATAVYPPGGGSFDGDAQGWAVVDETCNVPVLCSAGGEHDPGQGNPSGSMTAKTTVFVNLLSFFESTVAFRSPEFTVTAGDAGVLLADRQFVVGGLVDLGPEVAYEVNLIDTTGGQEAGEVTETLTDPSPEFATREAAVALTPGHSYAIEVEATTTSSLVSLTVSGSTELRFDNVALSVQVPDTPGGDPGDEGGGGGDGGNGGGGGRGGDGSGGASAAISSASELLSALRKEAATNVTLKGKQVLAKVSCPARVEKKCSIATHAKIGKRVVTARRTAKVAKGKSRVVKLRVKPRFRKAVAKRKRLQIVQKVSAGEIKATFAQSRKVVRGR